MIRDVQLALLAVLVLSCWLGCLGMVRMKTPTQALHYLALPCFIGGALLPVAIFCVTGWSIAMLKGALIAFFLIATNSVVAHATARAFRVRSVGHWQPRADDARIQFATERDSGREPRQPGNTPRR